MRYLIVVVPSAVCDDAYASSLVRALTDQHLSTWSLGTHTKPGDSLIHEIDWAVRDALMLLLVRSPGVPEDPWSAIIRRAFQAQTNYDSRKLIVVQRGKIVLEPSIAAQAIILPDGLDADSVASQCAGAIRFLKAAAFSPAPILDNRNYPLISAGAWNLTSNVHANYDGYYAAVNQLIELREFEHARELYWKALHYSGFRELWGQRRTMSERLLALALSVGDLTTASMVLVKGLSYAYIAQREYDKAVAVLDRAQLLAQQQRDERPQAVIMNYRGQIAEETGDVAVALRLYSDAGATLGGVEEYQIHLKRQLLLAVNSEDAVTVKVGQLGRLRNEFASISDYRQEMVDLEVAKIAWRAGGKKDALFHVNRAISEFENMIIMPRNARRATVLLNSFNENEPVFDQGGSGE